jgi:hypothetical protein
MASKTKKSGKDVGMWEAIRDVLIFSMRKGQLPALGAMAILALIVYKTPSEYFPTIWAKLFAAKGILLSVSISLNVVMALLWAAHTKRQRRWFQEESVRLIDVRNDLQQRQIGTTLESSEGRS